MDARLKRQIVSGIGLGFSCPELLPFPAIWLGCDVRGECSTKTVRIRSRREGEERLKKSMYTLDT